VLLLVIYLWRGEKMKRFLVFMTVVMFCMECAEAANWTTLPFFPSGIDGDNVVGIDADSYGEIYDLNAGTSKWFTFGPGIPFYTTGISSNNVVGVVTEGVTNGFLWTNIGGAGVVNHFQNPFSHAYTNPFDLSILHDLTYPHDIEGSNIVGYYQDNNFNFHGFLYTGSAWTTLDYLGANATYVYGISGNNLVGQYCLSGNDYGFLYNIATNAWSTIPILASAVDGSNIVGGNLLYNITTGSLTTLDVPGSITGISGNNLVGTYSDASGEHGFIYTIPEPATLLLLGLGAMRLRKMKR
jgi:hypothetical protein